jgi:hypothetical protein
MDLATMHETKEKMMACGAIAWEKASEEVEVKSKGF